MMDELLAQFLIEGRELVAAATDALDALARDLGDREAIDAAFRAVHTLKGSVALFDMAPAGRLLHDAEDLLERARRGDAPLHGPALQALVACVDRVDSWIDAMEQSGALPADASDAPDRIAAALGSRSEAEMTVGTGKQPGWVGSLAQREEALLASIEQDVVAFRYAPDPECFFRGDDPLALVEAMPALRTLHITPSTPWGDAESIEPFQSHLIFEGISAAPPDILKAHFRLVSDQIAFHPLRPRQISELAQTEHRTRTLRVDMSRVDALADGLGELIVAGNAIEPLIAEVASLDVALGARLRAAHGSIDRANNRVQRAVVELRLVPIAPALRRLPRLVRDLSTELGKSVDFRIDGDSLEVDKAIVDALYEPLLHLVRNAIDHGVESPMDRVQAGKAEQGRLVLGFRRVGDRLEVSLSDDGAGMDPVRIRQIAVCREVISAEDGASLDDDGAINLVFAPGFSSADSVTSVSGRGVGMDAVRSALRQIGAEIRIESVLGSGTSMRMSFPLSAITTRMLVIQSGGDRYAVPFDKVSETVVVPATTATSLAGGEALVLRDRTIPLLHLAELLGKSRATGSKLRLMVAQDGAERVAIAVDGFEQQISASVRRASGLLADIPGVAGTTILGDGEVLIVLDPERLIA